MGGFAVQIARAMGAEVVAQVRREAQVEHAVALGAAEVVVTDDGEALDDTEGYRLVVDGIGGRRAGKRSGPSPKASSTEPSRAKPCSASTETSPFNQNVVHTPRATLRRIPESRD
ncbi:MAG: zinc-binding dehydrogenase [Myxococcota bacterium]